MRFSTSSGQLNAAFNPFADSYLVEILRTVALAWTRMKQPKSTEIEDRITRKLTACLRHDPTFRDLPFDVSQQVILDDIDANYLGRLDLQVKHRHSARDYFGFEAKRLHLSYSPEYLTYVSDKGMGAFIGGPYSGGLPAAGMLGYVMDAQTDKAWAGLTARIDDKRETLQLLTSTGLVVSPLSDGVSAGLQGTLLGETQHSLASHVLRLFHLLLPVQKL